MAQTIFHARSSHGVGHILLAQGWNGQVGERDMQNGQTSPEDLINSLGTIYGVSEIKKTTSEDLSCCPVLVAENALFFFAWDEKEGERGN